MAPDMIKWSSGNINPVEGDYLMSKPMMIMPAVSLLALTVLSGLSVAAPDPPPPDLYIAYLGFYRPDGSDWLAPAGEQVIVGAVVAANGTGDSAAANASFFCDGTFLGLMRVPAMAPLDNFTAVRLLWDTAGWPAGPHNLSVALDAPGDPDITNNNATAGIVLYEKPVLGIEIDQPYVTVNGTLAGPSRKQVFSGNVTVNRSGAEGLAVTLRIRGDWGHAGSVDPSEIFFGPGNGSQRFTLTTWATGSGNDGWSVAIVANASGPFFSVEAQAFAAVFFDPGTALLLFTDTSYLELGAAKKATITFHAENRGSREATFLLRIDNERELRDSGWELRLRPDNLTLEAGETAEVTLTAEYTREWPPGGAIYPVYDSPHIVVRATAADGSMSTTGEVTLERQGYNGRSLLLVTTVSAAATIGFLILPLKWPNKGRPHGRKAVLAMYWAATFALALGLFVVLLSQGLYYRLATEDGHINSSGGGWGPGALVLPFALPFILIGTYILLYLLGDRQSRQRPWPYLAILASEAAFLIAFMPYPMGFFHASRWGFSDATINVAPLIDNWGPFFLLLFVLIFSTGWALWYLFRPESWPLKEKEMSVKPRKDGPT
jgi:hypothetical protein